MKTLRATLGILLLVGGIFLVSGVGFATDANFNTQSADLRSNGSNGNPGFDPCVGGSNVNGTCTATAAGVLLSTATVGTGSTPGLFEKLGPGAVTNNMFGVIDNPASPGVCSPQSTGAASTVGTGTLDCGSVRWDPTTQGQTLPAGNNTLNLNTPITMNTSFSGDFCANGGTDCLLVAVQQVGAHTGFSVTNNFTWTGLTVTTATASSVQDVNQVTAVKQTGVGTFAAPGTGDQVVQIHTDWATTALNSSSNSATSMPANLNINWHQVIQDPDQSGFGSSIFSQDIQGSFALNTVPGNVFPTVQYPDGQSQTNGAAATIP